MARNEYNVYCVSTDDENEEMSSFQNSLPRHLDLKDGRWEIGMTGFGLQLNDDILYGKASQPKLAILKNATASSREVAYSDILHIWHPPDIVMQNLTLRNIASSLNVFLTTWVDGNVIRAKKNGRYSFRIQSGRAEKTTLLIHPDLVRLFGFSNLGVIKTSTGDTDILQMKAIFMSVYYFLGQISKNRTIKGKKERKNIDRPLLPCSVSVSADIVMETPDSNKYSTVVYDTALTKSFQENNNYFYHYVKNIKYYPVRNTDVQTIRLQIFDIHERKLALKKTKANPVSLIFTSEK